MEMEIGLLGARHIYLYTLEKMATLRHINITEIELQCIKSIQKKTKKN